MVFGEKVDCSDRSAEVTLTIYPSFLLIGKFNLTLHFFIQGCDFLWSWAALNLIDQWVKISQNLNSLEKD